MCTEGGCGWGGGGGWGGGDRGGASLGLYNASMMLGGFPVEPVLQGRSFGKSQTLPWIPTRNHTEVLRL